AGLGGGGNGDLVDPLGRDLGVSSQQLTDAVDDEVVCAGLGRDRVRLAERGTDAFEEDHVTGGSRDAILLTSNKVRQPGGTAGVRSRIRCPPTHTLQWLRGQGKYA